MNRNSQSLYYSPQLLKSNLVTLRLTDIPTFLLLGKFQTEPPSTQKHLCNHPMKKILIEEYLICHKKLKIVFNTLPAVKMDVLLLVELVALVADPLQMGHLVFVVDPLATNGVVSVLPHVTADKLKHQKQKYDHNPEILSSNK
ncbi:hypothetical protein CEXT_280411 [Caerostris extrusa]|uniref:Uncharacterized protein n=1 Tax=Caerostris extrusa TaxID=172846 RepID=A0AAV4UUW1_CAEEX|nr:hypothetical protein CEXT_280411 [Caerostris extrusa]